MTFQDKGLCFPTVLLWSIIMYVEVTMRVRDLINGQLHISLCQPFAAHCIGHPIVTLGIGFKSYVFYRLKLRAQWQVRKENLFYFELLKQALPRDLHPNNTIALTDKDKVEEVPQCNGFTFHQSSSLRKSIDRSAKSAEVQELTVPDNSSSSKSSSNQISNIPSAQKKHSCKEGGNANGSLMKPEHQVNIAPPVEGDIRKRNISANLNKKNTTPSNCDFLPSLPQSSKSPAKVGVSDTSLKLNKFSQNKPLRSESEKDLTYINSLPNELQKECNKRNNVQSTETKVELVSTSSAIEQLEATIAMLKTELASSQKNNSIAKTQIEQLISAERAAKTELSLLRKDHDSLQTKFNTLSSNKEKDRLNLLSLEKRLKSEVAARETGEKLLVEEKRQRKEVEDNATVALADRFFSLRGRTTVENPTKYQRE